MLRRIQQLRISLAKKCQLLFGAAVLLIIGAALFVPWHRIEDLTEQLNERAAQSVADYALAEHKAQVAQRFPVSPAATLPAASQPALEAQPPEAQAVDTPTTRAAGIGGREAPQPRLVQIGPRKANNDISRFETRAIFHFLRNRNSPFYASYYERADGSSGYRYAHPLRYVERECRACHIPVTAKEAIAAMTQPSTRPSTLPDESAAALADAVASANAAGLIPLPVSPLPDENATGHDAIPPLAGVVSVDLVSRIDAAALQVNRLFILGALLLASALAITTFYYITTRLILQPVRVLQETADKVSRGDLNIRSDISTGDEFQQLSETFNTMLTNLKRSSDKLVALNKSLDIKLGQLAESNVALFESNRLKSEFLANVSHELRTPLNSILGFAELLKDGINAPAEAKSVRYISNILASGKHLLDLINDLLDLAKIEAGRMEVRSEPLSLSDMFEGLANLLHSLLQQRNLTLSVSVSPEIPILQADAGKLQQVLYNFLSNAIKFSPVGGVIELKATLEQPDDRENPPPTGQPAGDAPPATPRLPRPDRARPTDVDEPQVRISVTDRGPGIAADKQNVIFEKFRQIDGGHTRSHGGSGLGLAISKELMLLMGGTIGVKSKVGEGATFWILLPLKVDAGSRDVRSRMVMS